MYKVTRNTLMLVHRKLAHIYENLKINGEKYVWIYIPQNDVAKRSPIFIFIRNVTYLFYRYTGNLII